MPYSTAISRLNPSCFVFVIDQSSSMAQRSIGEGASNTKAEDVALAINNFLRELVLLCSKDETEGVRDYFHVAVIGYGKTVGSALAGPLADRNLIPISEIADNPARIEARTRRVPDGVGGLVEQAVRFPIWVDAKANGSTPMSQAMKASHALIADWLSRFPDCFPPTVVHITDGESTDGDPSYDMVFLTDLASSDGNVQLCNFHLSSKSRAKSVSFPDTPDNLPDEYARMLFHTASYLSPFQSAIAQEFGHNVAEGSKLFVLNADLTLLIEALIVGTKPSNLGN